jgi:type I restriction enzyme M protein
MNKKISESITENIFREFYGAKTFLEKSAITDKYSFKSKKNSNYKGYPDFFKEEDEYLIVVECKAETKQQEQAENEVKHYMSNVSSEYNTIGIAVSGQNEEELKVSYFLTIKGEKKVISLNMKNLLSLAEINSIYMEISTKENYESLIKYADKLNTKFHEDFKLAVHKRPFFFAGLLFSFDKLNTFLNQYKNDKVKIFNERSNKQEELSFNDPKLSESDKIDYINSIISEGIAEKFVGKLNNKFKTIDIPAKFQFIKTDNKNITVDKYISFLKEFIQVFNGFKQTVKYYDVIGTFYSEFLRYVQKAGGQDIVLTPDHIKTFMCELVDLQEDSVVLDICVGSGGFSAVSYGMMDRKLREGNNWSFEKSEHIKEKQIIGVEIDEDMYSLAFSNMILHGDGKSNLYKGNSLTNFEVEQKEDINGNIKSVFFEDKVKELQPNISLMNPPYNDDAAPEFILRLVKLLKMAGNGTRTACVIAPSSCLRKKPELTREIFEIAKLTTVIDMNGGLFSSQNISAKTSIFIFEVGSKHSGETYFYDFKEDGYKYSKRKMENIGDWNQLKNKALKSIKDKEIIDEQAYREKLVKIFLRIQFIHLKRSSKLLT